jgi:hypothetical protein
MAHGPRGERRPEDPAAISRANPGGKAALNLKLRFTAWHWQFE